MLNDAYFDRPRFLTPGAALLAFGYIDLDTIPWNRIQDEDEDDVVVSVGEPDPGITEDDLF